jgi:hypothetical protein
MDSGKDRVFAASMQYIIDCDSGEDLIKSLNGLEDKAIKDYCGGDIDRRKSHRAGVHQVMTHLC